MKNFKMTKLESNDLKKVLGGTSCPTYDIQSNSDALVYSTKSAAPYAAGLIKTFATEIMKFIFL
ncbi:MAG: hypothetical protein MI739_12210 [Bacteroidales bacterium]|nr:hypothetical protein [Bacteroidales bacterium]